GLSSARTSCEHVMASTSAISGATNVVKRFIGVSSSCLPHAPPTGRPCNCHGGRRSLGYPKRHTNRRFVVRGVTIFSDEYSVKAVPEAHPKDRGDPAKL